MGIASLGFKVELDDVKAATIALDELAEAAQRAHTAIQKLTGRHATSIVVRGESFGRAEVDEMLKSMNGGGGGSGV